MNDKMKKPNIFNYATSELSQDAIICYILEWGKSRNKEIDVNLHSLAINFLDSIFEKFEKINKPIIYDEIDIRKQYKNIDILCVINKKYSIIIEDKTNSKNHSGQLEKYLKTIQEDFPETEIMRVYFKTGDQSNYNDINDAGYQVYIRKDFLSVLKENNTSDTIVQDYTNYLQNIDNEVNSYKDLPFDKWTWNSWKGFFMALQSQKELKKGDWEYTPNRGGGFLCFYWCSQKYDDGIEASIQLEEEELCFKIWVKEKSKRTSLREKFCKSMIEKSKDEGIDLEEPKRFGFGYSMTVCKLKNGYREEKNGKINLERTVSTLKKAEKLLESLADEFKELVKQNRK